MTDTRALLNKLSAFRERLESMPRLIPDAIPLPQPATGPVEESWPARLAAGSRTQAILEQSIRALSDDAPGEQPAPTQLIAKARRILTEARELIECLRKLADDPLLRGLHRPSRGASRPTRLPFITAKRRR